MMRFEGPQWAAGLEVLEALEREGCEAYFVGGCVRDALLGRVTHDIDIATSAPPEHVLWLFPDALPTGLKHGTVTVRRTGFFFEVTTFRQESGYSDGRRPDEVFFVRDVREDLARRDFTINAMAAGADGRMVDPFGGVGDLQARRVRTVGEPALRFGEDALRIVRCVRFAAEFGFGIDGPTWDGVLAARDQLRFIATERIGAELDKMCGGRDPGRAFELLLSAELPERFKSPPPEAWLAGLRQAAFEAGGSDTSPASGAETSDVETISKEDSASPHSAASATSIRRIGAEKALLAAGPVRAQGIAKFMPISADTDLRWAALLLAGRASPQDAEETMKLLHYASKRIKRVTDIIRLHVGLQASASGFEAWRRSWTMAVLDFGPAAAADWIKLFETQRMREAFDVPDALHAAVPQWTAAMPAVRIPELAVRGDELAAASGEPPGPWIAKALRELLERVAMGELANDEAGLRAAFLRGHKQ